MFNGCSGALMCRRYVCILFNLFFLILCYSFLSFFPAFSCDPFKIRNTQTKIARKLVTCRTIRFYVERLRGLRNLGLKLIGVLLLVYIASSFRRSTSSFPIPGSALFWGFGETLYRGGWVGALEMPNGPGWPEISALLPRVVPAKSTAAPPSLPELPSGQLPCRSYPP